MATTQTQLGWRRDANVARNSCEPRAAAITQPHASLRLTATAKRKCGPLNPSLRPPPEEDQHGKGYHTDSASFDAIKHFERLACGKHLDGSRLFLYKATRTLAGDKGDSGAQLRDTMKALVLFGVPPEQYHLCNVAQFDLEPSAFCYAFAQSYKAVRYYRLDPPGTPISKRLSIIKTRLSANLPSMFGFSLYSSIYDATNKPGEIPYPGPGDKIVSGDTVVAIGSDDEKKQQKQRCLINYKPKGSRKLKT